MVRPYVNPLAWHQAVGIARHSCARIFRDGGSAADAMRVFGCASDPGRCDWTKAVDAIALRLCRP